MRVEREAGHSPLPNAEVKKARSFIFIPSVCVDDVLLGYSNNAAYIFHFLGVSHVCLSVRKKQFEKC
jgi:hypothetical protein